MREWIFDADEHADEHTDAPPKPLSITELTDQIKATVEGRFPSVWVAGEITDIARPRSGHVYFTLKDAGATIRGIMWRGTASRLEFDLTDGQEILCQGNVEVYAARGSYQLIVRQAQPMGLGRLQAAFAKLQARLDAEGLFSADRKRPLPPLPTRIALVTSPTGAAIRDFLQTAATRHPGVVITVLPARVQGPGSGREVVAAIAAAHRLTPQPDILILSRGGGSLEDLWTFNEEPVVRALAASRIPTVSAVGHEIDVTLCDLVADVRALTPTDGAIRALPDSAALRTALQSLKTRLGQTLRSRLRQARDRAESLATRPVITRPHRLITDRALAVDQIEERLNAAIRQSLRRRRDAMRTLAASTEALSPLAVLSRGYAVVQTTEGETVRDASTTASGDAIEIKLHRGKLKATVD